MNARVLLVVKLTSSPYLTKERIILLRNREDRGQQTEGVEWPMT